MDAARTTGSAPRGFTLVEALVALAVLAIVAAGAVPGLAGLLDGRRLNAAAAALATDVQAARVDAVARDRVLRLAVQASGAASCWVLHTGPANACACTGAAPVCGAGATALRTARFDAADRVAVAANVGSIAFDPLHGTATPAGTLRVVGSDGRAVHHVVNAMGRARTCSPGGLAPGHRAC
jgi:type IV fimbrial biogenesis protein FimT